MADLQELVRAGRLLPLIVLLLRTRKGFRSTNPRDKVFALLGISNDRFQLPFIPDYKEGVSEVFLKTARFFLSSKYWRLLLCYSGHGYITWITRRSSSESKNPNPSWAPNWSSYQADPRLAPDWTISPDLAYMEEGEVYFTENPLIIRLKGMEVDKIAHIGAPYIPYNNLFKNSEPSSNTVQLLYDNLIYIYNWYTQSRKLARECSSSARRGREVVDEEFWEVCTSRWPEKDPQYLTILRASWESVFLHFEQISQTLDSNEGMKQYFSSNPDFISNPKDFLQLNKGEFMTLSDAAFAITVTGTMALVPPLSRPEDLIYRFRGISCPFVVRSGKDGTYELMGICNLHNIEMDDISQRYNSLKDCFIS